MGNMWDLEPVNPLSGKRPRSKKSRKMKREDSEEPNMMGETNKLMKTTSDFMMGAMGISVMSNMGFAVIGALTPKK